MCSSDLIRLLIPIDHVAADNFSNDAKRDICFGACIPDGWQSLDIGPETCKLFAGVIKESKTVVWNGPMGVFEFENFASGTKEIAKAVADSGAVSIIGGGDSAAAIEKLGFSGAVTHVSTGGGAALEFLEGLILPGVECLQDKDRKSCPVCSSDKTKFGKLTGCASLQPLETDSGISDLVFMFCADCGEVISISVADPSKIT